jgi:hypothetical protein
MDLPSITRKFAAARSFKIGFFFRGDPDEKNRLQC